MDKGAREEFDDYEDKNNKKPIRQDSQDEDDNACEDQLLLNTTNGNLKEISAAYESNYWLFRFERKSLILLT